MWLDDVIWPLEHIPIMYGNMYIGTFVKSCKIGYIVGLSKIEFPYAICQPRHCSLVQGVVNKRRVWSVKLL